MIQHVDRRAFLFGASAFGSAALLPGCATHEIPGAPRVVGLPAAAPTSAGMSADLTPSINAFMQNLIDTNKLTGGVTAVARHNKLVHFAAHGKLDLDAGTPMTTDRLFVMMSSTKPVTGVALLQQMEEGKVALNDPISKFIPELKDMKVRKAGAPRPAAGQKDDPANLEAANRTITIKDLATHTSGLNGSARRAGDTLVSHMPLLKDVPLDFQPGARWAYSATTGPDVLARVVEITSGIPYDQYLRERIFQPCGMVDTAHNLTAEQAARVVPRYSFRDGKWSRAGADAFNTLKTTYFAGSYGLKSTAADYLRFETMLLNKGAINGKRVLKPESVALMRTNLIGDLYRQAPGSGFGILARTVLDPAKCACGRGLSAFGWGGAYGTVSWTDPANDLVGVYMVQQPGTNGFATVVEKAIVA